MAGLGAGVGVGVGTGVGVATSGAGGGVGDVSFVTQLPQPAANRIKETVSNTALISRLVILKCLLVVGPSLRGLPGISNQELVGPAHPRGIELGWNLISGQS